MVKSGKHLVAYVAFVRFLPGVDAHMSGEIALLSKVLATNGTPIWFLP